MFKKHVISLFLLWLILVLGCFSLLHTSSSSAQRAYQRLMNDSDQIKKEQLKEEARSTQQTRYQVSKQILYKKGLHRMQSRLTSDYSNLYYSKAEGEIVEHFKGVTCAMQEKFIPASNQEKSVSALSTIELSQQMIRQFKAKEAVYSYKSGQLKAQEVEIANYLLPGYFWHPSFEAYHPLLQGKADTIQLSLFAEPHLKAQGFQAAFFDWGNE